MSGNLDQPKDYYIEKFVKCALCDNGQIFTPSQAAPFQCYKCAGTGFVKVFVKERSV